MYTLPLDVFGGARAAFAVSMLVASYGAVQAVISPLFGRLIDRYGYAPVTTIAALTPLAACAVLWITRSVRVKQRLKRWIFRLLGKDPEAVVVTFCTGDAELCRRMAEEVRRLVPDRRHFVATEENWPRAAARAAALPHRPRAGDARRASRARCAAPRIAWRRAKFWPTIRAWSATICGSDLASFLFWRGVPLDRIYLRPWWWPWPKRERSVTSRGLSRAGRPRLLAGAPPRGRALALLPLSALARRRGAHLSTCCARSRANSISSCSPSPTARPSRRAAPVLEFCARVVLVRKPRYREPRWSTLLPPEVHEFRSPAMQQRHRRGAPRFRFRAAAGGVHATGRYGGDILVEHDVTFDLFAQIARRERTSRRLVGLVPLAPLRNPRRARRYRRVVVMSPKDAEMLGPRRPPR